MQKSNCICQYLSQCFLISTILGFLILPFSIQGGQLFLALGGSSLYLSLGVFLSAVVNRFWGIAALIWVGLLTVAVVTAYVFSLWKRYWPMFIVLLLDLSAVSLFFLYMVATNNMSGVLFWCFDMTVSILCVVLFARNIYKIAHSSQRKSK